VVGVVAPVDGGFDGGDDDCGEEDPGGSSVGDGSPPEHPATATSAATATTPILIPTRQT
jgi:hypothetical protein